MSELKKRRSGSMFKWYFVQTTVSVLLCLAISSISVLFFFLNFWKNDRLTALNEDALSVSQSVALLVDEEKDSFYKDRNYATQLVANIISTVAQSSSSEIFMLNGDGEIIICFDADGNSGNGNVCEIHEHLNFPDEIIASVYNSPQDVHNYEGDMDGLFPEKYLLGVVKFKIEGNSYFVFAMQAESTALLPYTTEFLRNILFASTIGVFISFILALLISYRMVRPLKKITAATKQYAGGDFSARINTADVYDELSQLVDAVNIMADNLAVLEESRSSFVANVSHELKTPMTIISGFVDGILDGTISNEDSAKYLGIVSDEVKRLSRLVVAMLNMSKIEAGKLTPNLSQFSLNDILMKTFLGFEKYIEDKNIEISGFDNLEEVFVTADEALMTQVIYNLIDNAVKFTPENGQITLGLIKEKKEAVLSIRNTGKGISQEECGLIFDRFYKVDKSRGLDAKSFGLGLYIVRSIIELNHGTININSEIDKYTEFVIKMPLH